MFNKINKRNLVKSAAEIVTFTAAIEASAKAIEQVAPDEADENHIELGGMAMGSVVYFTMLSGRASDLVDRVADWRQDRKIKENAERNLKSVA